MKIPYGTCNFATIRQKGHLYIDKTPFLPALENAPGEYLIFLRPRRFGKSTLISTLANYYDIAMANQFDELFRGLWVHQNPTPEKNTYLVLTLDFSPVRTDGTAAEARTSFARIVKIALRSFIGHYKGLVPDLANLSPGVWSPEEDCGGLVAEALQIVADAGHHVYVLIDEYDHFGNRLLADGQEAVYRDLVGTTGFVRSFYAALKAATATSLARMFVTGVSPIMLDDLSSGFNIITQVSQATDFHAMAGFTQADVEHSVDLLLAANPALAADERIGNRATLMRTLESHYDGYRFSKYATDRLFNSTLVLYFLGQLARNNRYPEQMLDLNVRTDYGRLYQIARSTSEKDTDTRVLLEEILITGSVMTVLTEQFGTRLRMGRAQVASLFYYMGMLTFAPDSPTEGECKLVIPNRVMRELQWEYMAFALADHDGIVLEINALTDAIRSMAMRGDIQPLVDVFHDQVVKRMGLRELLTFNEQTMKLMLFAYLSQSQALYLMTEKEFNQGYCDLLLGIRGTGSAAKYAWIIEAKYVKTDATENEIEAAIKQGFTQIGKYAADKDLVAMLTRGHFLRAGVLVFVGVKDVLYRAWPTD